MYQVYVISDPTLDPSNSDHKFYIGRTKYPLMSRLGRHIQTAYGGRNNHMHKDVRSRLKNICDQGLLPIITPIREGLNHDEAVNLESTLTCDYIKAGYNILGQLADQIRSPSKKTRTYEKTKAEAKWLRLHCNQKVWSGKLFRTITAPMLVELFFEKYGWRPSETKVYNVIGNNVSYDPDWDPETRVYLSDIGA